MKKKLGKLVAVGAVALASGSGCQTYNDQVWTPDGFNYTHAVDHHNMAPAQHYFGLSWNLKPEKP